MPAPTPDIITGSNGIATVKVNALDYQCVMGAWRASFNKQYYAQTTFCSGGWADEASGLKQMTFTTTGFLSKNDPISDPLLDFGTANGVAVVLQADTGCTLTGTCHIEKDMGIVAAGNSEFGIRGRSKGAIASTWDTAV
jgi:hypothetical protein